MRFQVLLSLWSVTSCLCIEKIPEAAKTKDSKPKRYSLSKNIPPKNGSFKHAPTCLRHCVCKICKTPPKCIRNERRWSYYSRCSVVAAGPHVWRRCVSLWKRIYFVWASKRGSVVFTTLSQNSSTPILVCAAHFTEDCFLNLEEERTMLACTKTVSIKWSKFSLALLTHSL